MNNQLICILSFQIQKVKAYMNYLQKQKNFNIIYFYKSSTIYHISFLVIKHKLKNKRISLAVPQHYFYKPTLIILFYSDAYIQSKQMFTNRCK